MEEWKEYKISEIGTVVGGATPSTKDPHNYDGNIAWITPKDLSNFKGRYIEHGERMITEEGFANSSCKMLPKDSVLFSSRAPIGYVAIAKNELCTNQGFKNIIPNKKIVDSRYLYYLLVNNKTRIEGLGSGTTFKEVSGRVMKNISILLPPLAIQNHIASILSSLDDKIEVNQRINDNLLYPTLLAIQKRISLLKRKNDNLEQQAQAMFKSWFVDFEPFKDDELVESALGMIPKGWRVQRANDVFAINIGKTPPRKEKRWFSENTNDNIWVSIADMGSCGVFISDSSEYLTDEAIKRFNIQIVEKNSVLLSFKLTVGRVAIADTRLTTNEAIARFVLPRAYYREFLYLYLKQYKYDKLGSTSSIATAVNSKTIKGMNILIPSDSTLMVFSKLVKPLFDSIEALSKETVCLAKTRDALLPRLMSGKLKISKMDA